MIIFGRRLGLGRMDQSSRSRVAGSSLPTLDFIEHFLSALEAHYHEPKSFEEIHQDSKDDE